MGCLTALAIAVAVDEGFAGSVPASPAEAQIRGVCAQLTLGVHIDLAYERSAVERAKVVNAISSVLRVRIARNTLPWDRIESVPGQRNWSVADAVVNELTAARIEPLLVLMGSPSWANGTAPDVDAHQLYVPTSREKFAAWLSDFANFAYAAALRYRGKVHRWEIWNEPNFSAFWRPRPNADQYAETYKRLRASILAADPTSKVATGGVTILNVAWGSGNVRGLTFLDRLTRDGVRSSFVAIHPYTTPPHRPDSEVTKQNNFEDITRVHALLLKRGIRASIWVTEWGWSSEAVGLARQASYVQRSLEMLRDQYPYVTVATYFIDHDRPPRFYQGLLDSSLRPKPSARRFAAVAGGLERCKSGRRASSVKRGQVNSMRNQRSRLSVNGVVP